MGSRILVRSLGVGLLAIACWAPVPSGPALAAGQPEFKLGFASLASLIPGVAGNPAEEEHYSPTGDALQQTTTGLMVWRKADNWTAFTDGYRTWVNGPFGLQVRTNDQRFPWETSAPVPALPVPTPVPTASPVAAPSPIAEPSIPPLPKPSLRASQPNVVQGQGLQANSVWVMGELHNDGTVPAYNATVTAQLLSETGLVVGTSTRAYAYLGPGGALGYQVEVLNPLSLPYARADVSVDPGTGAFANFTTVPVTWVKNEMILDTRAGKRFEFTGILNNTGAKSVSLTAVYVWFLDDANRIVWADYTYISNALAPGDSYTFAIRTPWDSQNPQVTAITQVRYYAAGQLW